MANMQEDNPIGENSVVYNNMELVNNEVKAEENMASNVSTFNGIFNFSRLPWVIFLSILEFFNTTELCRLCLVNKFWHKACRDPSLWRLLDLAKYTDISDQVLDRLTSFSNNVVQLRISHCGSLTEIGVSCVLKRCSSLVELSVIHSEFSDFVLEAVAGYCQCLRKLDVSLSVNFSDEGIRKVCQGCPLLEELIIDQCRQLSSKTLISLGNHSSRLKSISTERISAVQDDGVAALVQGCPDLQSLRLPFCGLTNQCVFQIASNCHNIMRLDVRGISLDDNDVRTLVAALHKLECLNLSLCYNLTDWAAVEISYHCRSLKYLFLVHSKVTDHGLIQLGENCKSLQHLDVSWCPAVTETGARYVLQGCPNLKHLGLVRCDKVTESAVNELSSCHPQVFISTVKTEMDRFFSKESIQKNE